MAKLRQWIDVPAPMGLPIELQNLIILSFAAQTNRRFLRHGGPFEPEVDRLPDDLKEGSARGRIVFLAGDMLDPALGRFDYVVGMDSIIHYEADDAVRVLAGLALRTERAVLFTFAPKTPLLATARHIGRLFPKSDRAPWIVPIAPKRLLRSMAAEPAMDGMQPGRTQRVSSGFYTSQAMELTRS